MDQGDHVSTNRTRVLVELSPDAKRARVFFPYDLETKDAVKQVPGARFVVAKNGDPAHWTLPLEMTSMRRLREALGDRLVLGAAITVWARQAVKQESQLREMSVADDWPLKDLVIAKKLPRMAKWLRPYQRADIKFLASTSALNLLEPRLGKTTETIGAIYEANLEDGPHLIVAPQKSLDSVWRMEWERWTDMTVFTFSGETPKAARPGIMDDVLACIDASKPFVFVTTADMVRRGIECGASTGLELLIEWNSFTIDEFHKTGLPEVQNVFPKKAANIRAKRKYGLSGTPMSGKPIKLWGALHFLYPDDFTSKWRWADSWLVVETVFRNHKKIGGIKKGREDEFYEHLAPHCCRRLRTEVLPQLPPKQYIDVWCDMTPTQRKQYAAFARDAEVRIDEYHLSATSILAEYTRLKQFSNAKCEVEILGTDEETGQVDMKLKPTFDSGKLPVLLEKLAEQGIDPEDPTGTSQAIVSSQFRETIDMVYNYLTENKVKCIKITGKVSRAESERAQRTFKAGADSEGLRVVCMVTTIGVGLTLDNVETVHVMDSTWVPDDEDQLTDRAINTTRNHQVSVFRYISRDSIEQYIAEVNTEKAALNEQILDIRRNAHKALMKGAK
jgi:SNF2 family DNA or RNA helicase